MTKNGDGRNGPQLLFLAAGRNFYAFYEVSDVTLFER